jgi:hypothetical protein
MPRKRSEPVVAIALRVPLDIKRWIEERANKMLASQNSEIIRALRAQMVAEAASERRAG